MPPRLDVVTLSSGASAVTVTVSWTVDGDIWTLTVAVWPTSSWTPVRVDGGKALQLHRELIRADAHGYPVDTSFIRDAVNVLPVASLTAVTVTPGSTPPVESVTVPVRVASCANAGDRKHQKQCADDEEPPHEFIRALLEIHASHD